MSKHYNDDDLERALFNLELEEPPADLRAAILSQTIYRVPAAAVVRPWEPWLYGGLCALFVWLLIAAARGANPIAAAGLYTEQIAGFLSNSNTLLWIAVGGAAVWISQVNLTSIPGVARAARR